DDDLRPIIPVDGLRRGVLDELRPRPLEFFIEPIAVPSTWPDAPCGYVRLSPPYDPAFEGARSLGWPTRSMDAGHFEILVQPRVVIDLVLELIEEMRG